MRALLLLVSLWSHDDVERDRFKNPKDLAGYIAAQESPERAVWQKPDQILDALALKPGADSLRHRQRARLLRAPGGQAR